MKRKILIGLLIFFSLLLIPAGWLLLTESGLRWTINTASDFAPGTLDIGDIDGKLAGPITLRNIHYNVQNNDIRAERLELEWRVVELLAGRAHIQRLHTEKLTISLPPPTEPPPEKEEAPLTLPDIRLPLVVIVDDLQLNNTQLQRGGENLLTLQRARLDARAGPMQVRVDALEILAETFGFNARGQLSPHGDYRHHLTLDWHYNVPDLPPLEGSGVLQGDINSLRLDQDFSGLVEARLQARLTDALTNPRWQANADIPDFQTQQVNPAWPELSASLHMQAEGDFTTFTATGNFASDYPLTGPLNGDFRLGFHENQTLDVARLAVRNANNLLAVARGTWEPGPGFGQSHLALRWEDLTWPLIGEPQVVSNRGALQFSGRPDDYALSLAGNVDGGALPSGFVRTTGQGDLSHFIIQWLRIDTLEGFSTGDGRIAWQPQVQWQAELQGQGFNPAAQWPQWPGQLQFQLVSDGRIAETGLIADVNLQNLSGTLQDQPVEADARINLRDNRATIQSLNIEAGSAAFSAQGSAGEILDLTWKLRAPDLAELLPEGRGTLNSEGSIDGPLQTPRVALDLTGNNLAFRQHSLDSIQTQLRADLQDTDELQLDLQASGIKTAGQQIKQLQTTLSGTLQDHQLDTTITAPQGRVELALSGSLQQQTWRGRLTEASFADTQMGTWQLEQPGSIEIRELNSVDTDRLCWATDKSQLCLQARYSPESWRAQTTGQNLNLAWLEFALPEGMQLSGSADLNAEGQWQTGQTPDMEAVIDLAAGSVSYPIIEGERESWDYQNGKLTAHLDAQGARGQLQINMQEDDQLDAELRLPDLDPLQLDPGRQPIDGSVQLTFGNPEMFEVLLPEIQNLKGDLKVDFDVDGTLSQPQLQGSATLRNGGATIPQLGLTLEDITADVQSKTADTLAFNADIWSGDGKLQISGQVQLSPPKGWPVNVNITGKEVLVSRTPEARVYVSPDLDIRIQDREIHVDGVVRVPIARIEPKDVADAVTASNDVVIVGREQPEEEQWKIYSEVRVILGERVRYRGQGFEGRIEGNFVVRDEPGQLTTASGELTIPEGRYEAYGQRLEVQDGRIIFTGGPLTNPGLNIRATRTVGDVVAGIRLQGTLQSPQLELFSIPPMGQADTLAYLILGRPLDESSEEDGTVMAQAALALSLKGGDILARNIGERFGLEEMRIETGQTGEEASLVIGRYLSPRLYVSYGVGLLQAVNTAAITYEISRRWEFRAEAGEQQGGDFIYSIEKGD